MKKIKIGDINIGQNEKTFVIAEAGLNHDGDFDQAQKLVEEAAKVGADAVKFQIFKTEEFCTYDSEYFNLFKSLELKTDEWKELTNFAKDIGIIFTASVFGEESTDFLKEMGTPFIQNSLWRFNSSTSYKIYFKEGHTNNIIHRDVNNW